jgi:hypothetical protein
MVGALSRAASRPRRRYAGGGPVDDDDDIPGSTPPPIAEDMYPEAQPAASDAAGPLATVAGDAGAQPTPPAANDDSTQQQGALSRAAQRPPTPAELDAQQRQRDLQNSMNIMQASRGGINVPLLAMAGALLSPTRTGSIGESIGNAFSVGAQAQTQQNQLDSQNAMRLAQQADTNAYRQSMIASRDYSTNTHADTAADATGQRADAANLRYDASTQNAATRAATAAAGQALKASQIENTASFQAGKLDYMNRGLDEKTAAAQARQDYLNRSLDQSGALRTTQQQLAQLGHNDQEIGQILSAAKSNYAADPSKPFQYYVDQVTKARSALPGGSTGPAVPIPGGQTPAPMPGTQPAQPAQPAQTPRVGPHLPPGFPSGSLYNFSRNAWKWPDGTIHPNPSGT